MKQNSIVVMERGKPKLRIFCHHVEMGVCFDCMLAQLPAKPTGEQDDLERWEALFKR